MITSIGWVLETASGKYWNGAALDETGFTRDILGGSRDNLGGPKSAGAVFFARFEDAERVRLHLLDRIGWALRSQEHFDEATPDTTIRPLEEDAKKVVAGIRMEVVEAYRKPIFGGGLRPSPVVPVSPKRDGKVVPPEGYLNTPGYHWLLAPGAEFPTVAYWFSAQERWRMLLDGESVNHDSGIMYLAGWRYFSVCLFEGDAKRNRPEKIGVRDGVVAEGQG